MSRWKAYNCNPLKRKVGDCAIRACALATDVSWDRAFDEICNIAYIKKDVLSANAVWGQYLTEHGFKRKEVERDVSVDDFCHIRDHGKYVLGLDGHVVTVIDGKYYDTWDSGYKRVLYFWEK